MSPEETGQLGLITLAVLLGRAKHRGGLHASRGWGGPVLLSPPHESSGGTVKYLITCVVLDKTFLKVLICGTGTFLCGFPVAM